MPILADVTSIFLETWHVRSIPRPNSFLGNKIPSKNTLFIQVSKVLNYVNKDEIYSIGLQCSNFKNSNFNNIVMISNSLNFLEWNLILKELKYYHYWKKVKNLHSWIRMIDCHPFFGVNFTFGVRFTPKREISFLWIESHSKSKNLPLLFKSAKIPA